MGTGGHLGPGMMVLVEEGGSDTSAHSSELVLIFLQNSQKRSSPTEKLEKLIIKHVLSNKDKDINKCNFCNTAQ